MGMGMDRITRVIEGGMGACLIGRQKGIIIMPFVIREEFGMGWKSGLGWGMEYWLCMLC